MTGYNFDFVTSATVSSKVVKEMITTIIEEQTGRKVKEVTFKIREEGDERYRGSYSVFDGCTVTFSTESFSNSVDNHDWTS